MRVMWHDQTQLGIINVFNFDYGKILNTHQRNPAYYHHVEIDCGSTMEAGAFIGGGPATDDPRGNERPFLPQSLFGP